MDKAAILEKLRSFRERLEYEVIPAYAERGASYGGERFSKWRAQFTRFLEQSLPGTAADLNARLDKTGYVNVIVPGEPPVNVFLADEGEPCMAFIDSLSLDVRNDEIDLPQQPAAPQSALLEKPPIKNRRVFIVHGHEEVAKLKTARFIETLGLEAIILHEQANRGMTIIEKIEANTDVGFAIVIYTGDDTGNAKAEAAKGVYNHRARQNVVFEHGYLIAKLGRQHVVPLVSGRVELPSDIGGMVYVDDANWQVDIAKEMKSAGYDIDFNKIVGK